jgi:hypothetical protein
MTTEQYVYMYMICIIYDNIMLFSKNVPRRLRRVGSMPLSAVARFTSLRVAWTLPVVVAT